MENGELQIEDILIQSWAVPKTTLKYVNGDTGMRTWINDIFKVNL
jgi:hypothetical protein